MVFPRTVIIFGSLLHQNYGFRSLLVSILCVINTCGEKSHENVKLINKIIQNHVNKQFSRKTTALVKIKLFTGIGI